MANFKRGRPNNATHGGCKMCKPHKRCGCRQKRPREAARWKAMLDWDRGPESQP